MATLVEAKRKELKLSQDELARRLGISRQYYNAIENARRTPSVELAKHLSQILNLAWTIFFEDEVNKQATTEANE